MQLGEKKYSIQVSKNASIFLVCALVAGLFWTLKLLSSKYDTIIELPVNYINFPVDYAVTNYKPNSLAVKVEASGYDLVASSFKSQNDSLVVDGRYLSKNKVYSYIATDQILKQATENILSHFFISEILQDTLKFYFEKKITKVVPVIPNTQITLARQHTYNGEHELFPEAVKLTGPASVLDTINRIKTELVNITQLDEDFTAYLPLDLKDERVKILPKNVLLTVPVEKFTERKLKLIVTCASKAFSVKTFPSEIEVTCLVGISKYDNFNEKDIRLEVKLPEQGSFIDRLPVMVSAKPSFVKITKLEPRAVEFIIKKK